MGSVLWGTPRGISYILFIRLVVVTFVTINPLTVVRYLPVRRYDGHGLSKIPYSQNFASGGRVRVE
jgi:hypothetical protein